MQSCLLFMYNFCRMDWWVYHWQEFWFTRLTCDVVSTWCDNLSRLLTEVPCGGAQLDDSPPYMLDIDSSIVCYHVSCQSLAPIFFNSLAWALCAWRRLKPYFIRKTDISSTWAPLLLRGGIVLTECWLYPQCNALVSKTCDASTDDNHVRPPWFMDTQYFRIVDEEYWRCGQSRLAVQCRVAWELYRANCQMWIGHWWMPPQIALISPLVITPLNGVPLIYLLKASAHVRISSCCCLEYLENEKAQALFPVYFSRSFSGPTLEPLSAALFTDERTFASCTGQSYGGSSMWAIDFKAEMLQKLTVDERQHISFIGLDVCYLLIVIKL